MILYAGAETQDGYYNGSLLKQPVVFPMQGKRAVLIQIPSADHETVFR